MNSGAGGAPAPALDRLQRWMQAVITDPHGVRSGVASEAARCSLDIDLETLERVVAPSASLSGGARLAIYARSYHARLLQCFQSMFPALLKALGEPLFNHFALDYLQHHPPCSYTLEHLADAFPQHLAATRPDRAAPPTERESWPDFIIDLALLEWTFLKVYDGPGVEGRTLPRAQDVLAIRPRRLLEARPAPVSCLRLFAFRYPVHAYLLAVRRGQTPELPAPAASFVAVTRWNYRVRLYELTAPQHALLRAFDGRRTISQIINRDARHDAGGESSIATVRNWLCDWAAKGLFKSIQVADD